MCEGAKYTEGKGEISTVEMGEMRRDDDRGEKRTPEEEKEKEEKKTVRTREISVRGTCDGGNGTQDARVCVCGTRVRDRERRALLGARERGRWRRGDEGDRRDKEDPGGPGMANGGAVRPTQTGPRFKAPGPARYISFRLFLGYDHLPSSRPCNTLAFTTKRHRHALAGMHVRSRVREKRASVRV